MKDYSDFESEILSDEFVRSVEQDVRKAAETSGKSPTPSEEAAQYAVSFTISALRRYHEWLTSQL